jgi:hypothetical protein
MSNKTSAAVLRAVTQRVVDQFTNAGMLFTALDVSNAVKQTLSDVRHREVAPLVRDLYARRAMGDYAQSMIDVIADGKKPAQAYLYHMPEHPTSLYDDAMRSQLAIPPVSASAQDDNETVSPKTKETKVAVGRDGRGRVPLRLVRNAGIDSDEVVARATQSPPRVEIVVSDGSDVLSSDGYEDLLPCEHPSLLHVPRKLMSVFGPGSALVARIQNDTVEIVEE